MSNLKVAANLILVFVFLGGVAAAEPAGAPSPEVISQHAKETSDKLSKSAAQWAATVCLAPGRNINVNWLTSLNKYSVDISVPVRGKPVSLANIISRDGFWYVTQGDRFERYRPFEAPFEIPNLPLFYAMSLPRPATSLPAGITFDNLKDSTATYRLPLSEATRAQMQSVLDQVNEKAKTQPQILDNPDLKKTLSQLRDLLANGIVVRIDGSNPHPIPVSGGLWTEPKW